MYEFNTPHNTFALSGLCVENPWHEDGAAVAILRYSKQKQRSTLNLCLLSWFVSKTTPSLLPTTESCFNIIGDKHLEVAKTAATVPLHTCNYKEVQGVGSTLSSYMLVRQFVSLPWLYTHIYKKCTEVLFHDYIHIYTKSVQEVHGCVDLVQSICTWSVSLYSFSF